MFRQLTELMVKWFSFKTLVTMVAAFALVGLVNLALSEQSGSGKTRKKSQNASGTAEIGSGTRKQTPTQKTQTTPKKKTEGQSQTQTQTGTQSTTKTKKQESSKPSGIWVPHSTAPGLRKPGTYY